MKSIGFFVPLLMALINLPLAIDGSHFSWVAFGMCLGISIAGLILWIGEPK